MISHYPSGAASPRPLIGLAVVLCLCLGQLGWTGQKQGPQPLAGISIRNYADLTYTDSVTGVQLNVRSNTVVVQIQALEALSLVADNSIEAPVGTIACLPHCLTNTGNVTSECLLSLENLPADDSDLGGLRLVHDVNGSGVADPGEPTILPTTPVQLEPEACLDLVVEGRVLGAAGAGCEARVKVTAKTVLQGLTVSNTDCVRAIGTVTWKVTKSASDLSPERGQLVTFTLRADLEGRVQPGPHSITVDGQTRSLVCFRDAIPVNTTFASLSDPGSGVPLYHLSGAPADTYVSAAPSDLSSIDAVGYGVESAVPGNGFGFGFAVRISDIASGTIPNIAWVQYTDPVTDRPGEAPSNRVELVLATLPPQVAFYVDGTFARITCVGAVGTPLYVQALIAYDNKEPAVVETVTITLSSALTGDVETFAAVETGPNTGIFRIVPPVPTRRAEQGSSGDGVIDSITNDTIKARATGSDGQTAQACLQMDPTNVVFDSHTNQPITGARVTLIDVTGEGNGGKPGEPAVVYLADGVTTAPCAIETASNGCFAFCMVKASTYQLVVAPPGNYHFPTALAPTELPSDRLIGADASYGRSFTITDAVGFVRFDIPLDAPPPTGLFVQKQASRSVVTIGDFVDYRLQVRNASNVLLQAVSLSDRLPAGFSYVAGTARLDGQAIADPAGGAGPALTFELGELEPETEVRLTYRVRVGPGAVLGDATNRARAEAESAWGPVLSNFASATVRLEAGVFSDRSVVMGRIFVDGNENGLHDHNEPGVPGVRIYLEDGTYAVTDSEGKYSLYGLRSGSRVLKVDPVTLPPGASLSPITRRHLDDGGSVLADLKNGQLQKINFALVKPTAALSAEVERRRSLGEVVVPEVNRAVQETVSPDGLPPELSDVRGRPANGMIGADAGSSDRIYRSTLPPESELADPSLPDPPVRPAATVPLEALLPTLDNTLGFVGLKDQDTMPMAQVNVQAKGRMGSSLTLKLNGAEVPSHRVGSRASVPEKQLQVVQYIGLELRPGANQLELLESDSFGNARGKAEITIIAPGRPGKLNVEMPTQGQPADGKTAVPIRISIADQQGTVVSARTPVTLEASLGRWDVDDLDPNEPGVQVFVEGGSREVQLLAPAEPGAARVIVSSGLLKSESVVRFLPDLRPLLGLGVLEAKLNFRSGAVGDGLVQPFDPFENELRSLTHVSSDGDWRLSGRAALFLKWRVG
ncbi:MAG: SdrD B-like domain-containing protein [Armatimonadia bacterium]